MKNTDNSIGLDNEPERKQETSSIDKIIELYKRDIDRTLLRENLKLTPEERFLKFEEFMKYVDELHEAGKRAREAKQ